MPHVTLIDGYNLIRSSNWLSKGSFDAQRERLIQFLVMRYRQGSPKNRYIVIFDGKPGRNPPSSRLGISVQFSLDKDADSVIKNAVDHMTQPKEAVVVTNDRAIQRWVRGAKARVISCEDFLRSGRLSPKRKQSKEIDASSANAITQELEKLWVKKKH
jgi:predicted RNA-binding protein with PIN domain